MSQAGEDHQTARARARVGSVLDEKWLLDSLLGVGGMASVYAATHRNGKRAAIKVLHPEAALNPGVKARFLREGYVANRVGHPGAVSILDDDTTPDGTVFLVMELLEGETVDAMWHRAGRRLDESSVLIIVDQVLDVLVAAHAKQIVHRDLKPGNLFVMRDGTVKVLDFGIARLGDLAPDQVSATTSVHSSMGTLGFMPPEQARGRWEQVDARTDLWAVGATMHALLTGRHVHVAATANEQLLLAMTQVASPIVTVNAAISAPVARVVDRALQYQTADRWETARAMQDAVRDAYVTQAGRALSLAPRLVVSEEHAEAGSRAEVEHARTELATSGSIRFARKPGSSGKGLALGALAAVAVAGVVGLRMARHGSPPPARSNDDTPAAAITAAATPSPPGAADANAPTADDAAAPADSETTSAHDLPAPAVPSAPSAPSHRHPPARPSSGVPAPALSASAAPPVDLFGRRR